MGTLSYIPALIKFGSNSGNSILASFVTLYIEAPDSSTILKMEGGGCI